MALKLYLHEASPPVRAVLMTAAAIGLELDKQVLNIFQGEQFKPEFLKLNPQHTVPTLVDGDYVIWDSHAIIPYLVSKYAKDDSLYPKDLQKRGTVDNRLHFDNSVLFAILVNIGRRIFLQGQNSFPQELLKEIEEAFTTLNTLLEKSKFTAGDEVTVADISLIACVTSLEYYVSVDEVKYPKLASWVKKIQALPFYELNEPGLKIYNEAVQERLQQ